MRDRSLAAAVDAVRALTALARTTVLFHVGGRPAVARVVRRAAHAQRATSVRLPRHDETIRRAHRAVQRARRIWPAEIKCLQAALVLEHVLRARGTRPTLRVGVRIDDGALSAHAWIEVDGCQLDDAPHAGAAYVMLRPPDQRTRLVAI